MRPENIHYHCKSWKRFCKKINNFLQYGFHKMGIILLIVIHFCSSIFLLLAFVHIASLGLSRSYGSWVYCLHIESMIDINKDNDVMWCGWFNATFNNISQLHQVSFIGEGNRSTMRRPPTSQNGNNTFNSNTFLFFHIFTVSICSHSIIGVVKIIW
jgi:hypothetical protein